jgi:hypothetical protein
MVTAEQVTAIVEYTQKALPPISEWTVPDGYPTSLGMCVLDSIWSMGVNYNRHVEPVLDRYRDIRSSTAGGVSDTPAMLAQTIRDCGGSESFAAEVKSRHRTSTRNGILKAEAVQRAATVLADAGIETSQDLGRANDDIRVSWLGIPGQRSGVSWRYFQMLAGVEGIKPDRMIHRFIVHATGGPVSNTEAVDILGRAQQRLPAPRPTLRQFDHAIWRHESRRK